ncbi:strawberry notch-like NTP hydrolase domain-containing protein [Alteromonas antoniana]|uniref:strawberry notch-like NTP hydrolase domain-containing protein n=1 Tax=Alteromonas antoniana TaxID=2803813 RepID=UPI001C493E73|nr:strawberry notch family protein [Alteromonas antoniana]
MATTTDSPKNIQETKWIDMSAYGIQLVMTKLSNERKYLVAWGVGDDSYDKLEKLGFVPRPNSKTVMFASHDKLNGSFFKQLQSLLPESKAVMLPVQKVLVPDLAAWAKSQSSSNDEEAVESKMQKDIKSLKVELSQDLLLGVNVDGDKVYDTPEGRVVEKADGGIVRMNFKSDKAQFLLAGKITSPDLAVIKAVEPFAREIIDGKIFHFDDLKRITGIIFDIDFDEYAEEQFDAGSSVLRRVESAITLALTNSLETMSNAADSETEFNEAVDSLFERKPYIPSAYLEQDASVVALPPSVSAVISDIAEAKSAQTVMITASNGGVLESAFPKSVNVKSHLVNYGVRPTVADVFRPGDSNVDYSADSRNFKSDDDYSLVVTNEPFKTMDSAKSYDGVKYTRQDLYDTAQSLISMAEDGAAVLAIQEPMNKNGAVDGEFKSFLEWLYPRYEVKDIVEMDNSLLGRSGESNNVRLIYVDGRQLIPDMDAEVPESIRISNEHAAIRVLSNVWLDKKAADTLEEKSSKREEVKRLSEILGQTELNGAKLVANKFQLPYKHSSKVDSGDAMVNRDLELATRKAHLRLVQAVGDIDEFVMDKLQMTEDQLHRCFNGEQVSAIAQMIHNEMNEKSFLLGDAPGQGKGRQISAYIRYKILNNELPVFITESDTLFTDIMRDLKDIESDHLINPYVINNDKTAFSKDGEPLDKGSHERNRVLLDGQMDLDQFNMLFVTYNQMRPTRHKIKSARRSSYAYKDSSQYEVIEYFRKNSRRRLAIAADEIHNGASLTGNTNDVVERLLDSVPSCLMATGTSARHIKNLSFYHRLIDIVDDREQFRHILAKGGVNVTTSFVQMLAEAGMYIRREEDLSKATYHKIKDVRPIEETVRIQDKASEVFSLLASLSGEAKEHIFAEERETALRDTISRYGGHLSKNSTSLQVGSSHFTSRFNNLLKMYLAALGTLSTVHSMFEQIKENRKPIISLNNTGSSFLNEYVQQKIALAQAKERGEELTESGAENLPKRIGDEWVFTHVPQFKDVLKQTAEKVMRLEVMKDGGKSKFSIPLGDLAPTSEVSTRLQEIVSKINKAIDAIPELHYAPIDIVKNAAVKNGLAIEEITGRSKGFVAHPEGGYTYKSLNKMAKPEAIAKYNSGEVDALVVNQSGSTGISLHASPEFADKRERFMITLEMMDDILKARQVENRINRKGQVSFPHYGYVEVDLPLAQLQVAIHNSRLQQFSASVTGSSESDAKRTISADIINKVGDEVCMNYVLENADVMQRMRLKPSDFIKGDDKYQFNGFATRFKDALARLPHAMQKHVLEEVVAAYNLELEARTARGQNALGKHDYNFNAETNREDVIKGVEKSHYESVWDQPLRLREIEYSPPALYTDETLMERIEESKSMLATEMEERGCATYDELVDKVCDFINENKRKFRDGDPDATAGQIQAYIQKAETLKELLPKIFVGQVIEAKSFTGDVKPAVICDLRIYSKNPLDWAVRYVRPGDNNTLSESLRNIVEEETKFRNESTDSQLIKFTGEAFESSHPLALEFATAKSKYRRESRVVMLGNMIEAIKLSEDLKAGTVGSYTNEKGERISCVMMPKDVAYDDILYRAQNLETTNDVLGYLAYTVKRRPGIGITQATIDSSMVGYSPTQNINLTINVDDDKVFFSFPKNAKHGKEFKTSEFRRAAGSSATFEQKKAYNVVTTTMDNLESILDFVYNETDHRLKTGSDGTIFISAINSGKLVVDDDYIDSAFENTSLAARGSQVAAAS